MKKSTIRQMSVLATSTIIATALVNAHSASAQMERNTLSAESVFLNNACS
jgi:hypothetical protein